MKHNSGFLALVDDAKSRVEEINVEEYTRRTRSGQNQILVDVREDSEWAAGHAAGAIHLGKGIIERDIESTIPEKGAAIVLYCGGGYRSALAADALTRMGYKNPVSLAGGWRAWNEAGLPVEKP
jgi:rhodanese-related sulfurtransferase